MHQQIKLGEYETQVSQYDYTIKWKFNFMISKYTTMHVHFMISKYTTINQLIVMSKWAHVYFIYWHLMEKTKILDKIIHCTKYIHKNIHLKIILCHVYIKRFCTIVKTRQ